MGSKISGWEGCAAYSDWDITKQKVDEMHETISESSAHLKSIAESLDHLVAPATGMGRIEVKVIMPVIYALCTMLVSVVIWFTGVEPSLQNRSKGHVMDTKN